MLKRNKISDISSGLFWQFIRTFAKTDIVLPSNKSSMNFYFDYFVTLDPTEIYKNLLAYLTIEI